MRSIEDQKAIKAIEFISMGNGGMTAEAKREFWFDYKKAPEDPVFGLAGLEALAAYFVDRKSEIEKKYGTDFARYYYRPAGPSTTGHHVTV